MSLSHLIVELEFLQCLANPAYLNFLIEHGYFKDPKFLAYLSYLKYFMEPPYSALVSYPNSLILLRLLNDSEFLKQLLAAPVPLVDYIHKQQYYHWLHLSKASEESQRP